MRSITLRPGEALTPEDVQDWINATTISARHGKEPAEWIAQAGVVAYLVELSIALGGPDLRQELSAAMTNKTGTAANKAGMRRLAKKTGLVFTKCGAPAYGGGTWIHPKAGVIFARWMSPAFAVRCDLDGSYGSMHAPALLGQLHSEGSGHA